MKLIILGAGGHGKVVADIAQQANRYEKIFFLDDKSQKSNVLGKCEEYLKFKDEDVEMYPAFGNNKFRIEWEEKLENSGIKLAKIIHPLAYISPLAKIEDGCVVMPYAIINTNVKIAKGCIVNCGSIVDHDCILNKGCHLAPGAIVKGENILPEYTKVDSGEVISLGMYK